MPEEYPPKADGWFRTYFPWSVWLLIVVAVVLGAAFTWLRVVNDEEVFAWLSLTVAGLPTAWATLRPLWFDRDNPFGVYKSMLSTITVPLLAAPAVGVGLAATVLIMAEQLGDERFVFWFDTDGRTSLVLLALTLGSLVVAIGGMLIGMVTSFCIVLPLMALLQSRRTLRANWLDDSPQHRRRNTAAIRMIVILLAIAVVSPGFILFGERSARSRDIWQLLETWPLVFSDPERYWGDAMWMLGVALIPVGVVLTILTVVLQRKDPEAYRRQGLDVSYRDPDAVNEDAASGEASGR